MKIREQLIGLCLAISCHTAAQYSGIPSFTPPQPASLAPHISDFGPKSPFAPVNSPCNSPVPYQPYRVGNAYDILRENDRELEIDLQRQSFAIRLTEQGFPSRSRMPGTGYFYEAYRQIDGMLRDSLPLDLGKAVFLVENALLGNTLDYASYEKAIDERADLCRWKMQEEKLSSQDNLAKNNILFRLLTETMTIKQPGTEKRITHYPVQYNLDDYRSRQDFTSHFVTTLLSTNEGQCYSMPLLYLVIAEKLGAEAFLSHSPLHSFIKIKDDSGRWYNLELTCRYILTDSHYVNNSRIGSDALRSGLYLSPLDKKEVIAGLMTQLGHYYYIKYDHDPFVLQCMHRSQEYIKTPVDAWRVESDYESKLLRTVMRLLRIKDADEMKKYYPGVYRHYLRLAELERNIRECGYQELPPEVYRAWLGHVEELKKEEAKRPQSPVRKIVR